jgi:hypothetical protein
MYGSRASRRMPGLSVSRVLELDVAVGVELEVALADVLEVDDDEEPHPLGSTSTSKAHDSSATNNADARTRGWLRR